ncbi:MAG: hypothetical protein FE78DRAFT_541918, partial [Acidomyces sp. 'richmondensis']
MAKGGQSTMNSRKTYCEDGFYDVDVFERVVLTNEMNTNLLEYRTNNKRDKVRRRQRLLLQIFLIFNFLLLFVNLLLLNLRPHPIRGLYGSFKDGFDTDLEIVRSEIELQQVTFTGGIHYDETGHVYIEETAGPRFVGLPEPAIDEAWESLLRGQIINLPSEEAGDVLDRTYLNPSFGLFETGLDAFHQLHCINRIRMALDEEYYGIQDLSPHGRRVH